MNILCLDFGLARIGVAIATTPLAEPLEVIANGVSSTALTVVTEKALARILVLIQEHAIEQIVVGISEGVMAEKSREFIYILKQKTELPITEMDETLSSYEAMVKSAHQSKSQRRDPQDHMAAAIILQDYLDSM